MLYLSLDESIGENEDRCHLQLHLSQKGEAEVVDHFFFHGLKVQIIQYNGWWFKMENINMR